MSITEKALQNHVIKRCREKNILAVKLNCDGRRGFPDLMLARAGSVVFVELKSAKKTGRLSALQKHTIAQLRAHDLTVQVVDSKDEIENIINVLCAQ